MMDINQSEINQKSIRNQKSPWSMIEARVRATRTWAMVRPCWKKQLSSCSFSVFFFSISLISFFFYLISFFLPLWFLLGNISFYQGLPLWECQAARYERRWCRPGSLMFYLFKTIFKLIQNQIKRKIHLPKVFH